MRGLSRMRSTNTRYERVTSAANFSRCRRRGILPVLLVGDRDAVAVADHRHAEQVDAVGDRERFEDGFQSLPVDWTISSARKRGFFGLLKEITGV